MNPRLLIPLTFSALLVACGGGGGGGDNNTGGGNNTPPPPAPETGVFLDAAVAGVAYASAPSGLTGITNASGEYQYRDGDTVTFSIGLITFPPVTAKGTVTPLDIADTEDPSDQRVVNMVRLLQTLDEDGNPDNGITVNVSARNNARAVEFDQPVDTFAADADVLFVVLNGGHTTAQVTALISVEDALAHFEGSLSEEGLSFGSLVGAWGVADEAGDENDLLGVIFLPDGTYVHVEVDSSDTEEESGMEWGTWERNADTGRMTIGGEVLAGQTFDQNGDTGLTDFIDGPAQLFVRPAGDQLIASVDENGDGTIDDTLAFDRLQADGIVGLWTVDPAAEDENDLLLVVILPDGEYVHMEVDFDSSETSGMEWGLGAWNQETNQFVVEDIFFDNNGTTGLTDVFNQIEDLYVFVDGDEMTVIGTAPGQVPEEGAEGLKFIRVQ